MSTIELKATTRDIKESLKELRKKFFVPGVLYGHGIENKSITVALNEFVKAYKKAGESTLVDLIIDEGRPAKVLVHAISRNVESDVPEHVDFYQVNMNEKLHADIPIIFDGDAPAVKTQGGTLISQIESVPVKCLPGDLVDAFHVDITVLDDFTKRILISDIKNIPDTMEVLRPSSSAVALVAPPRVMEVDVIPEDVAVEDGEEASAEGADGDKSAEGAAKEGEAAKEAAPAGKS